MVADQAQAHQEQQQQQSAAQPLSLADELRGIIAQSDSKTIPEPHHLKQEPKKQYLQQKPQTDYLGIDLSDDVDDEAVYGRNRKRKEQGQGMSR